MTSASAMTSKMECSLGTYPEPFSSLWSWPTGIVPSWTDVVSIRAATRERRARDCELSYDAGVLVQAAC